MAAAIHQRESFPFAGPVLHLDAEGAGSAQLDPVRARRYQHPALAGRTVVCLAGETVAVAEDRLLAFIGFDPAEVDGPLARTPRRGLGYVEWVLINDPDRAGAALALAPEVERAARLAPPAAWTAPAERRVRPREPGRACARGGAGLRPSGRQGRKGRGASRVRARGRAADWLGGAARRRPAAAARRPTGRLPRVPRAGVGLRHRRYAALERPARPASQTGRGAGSRARCRGGAAPRRVAGASYYAPGVPGFLASLPPGAGPHGRRFGGGTGHAARTVPRAAQHPRRLRRLVAGPAG